MPRIKTNESLNPLFYFVDKFSQDNPTKWMKDNRCLSSVALFVGVMVAISFSAYSTWKDLTAMKAHTSLVSPQSVNPWMGYFLISNAVTYSFGRGQRAMQFVSRGCKRQTGYSHRSMPNSAYRLIFGLECLSALIAALPLFRSIQTAGINMQDASCMQLNTTALRETAHDTCFKVVCDPTHVGLTFAAGATFACLAFFSMLSYDIPEFMKNVSALLSRSPCNHQRHAFRPPAGAMASRR